MLVDCHLLLAMIVITTNTTTKMMMMLVIILGATAATFAVIHTLLLTTRCCYDPSTESISTHMHMVREDGILDACCNVDELRSFAFAPW